VAKLPEDLVPQADVLDDVGKVVGAVANGAVTFQAIAAELGKVKRQGRYYRKAAEIVGLISNDGNTSRLTNFGSDYLAVLPRDRPQLLAKALTQNPVVWRLLGELKRSPTGMTTDDMISFLMRETTIGSSVTAGRRARTLRAWLVTAGFATVSPSRVLLPRDLPTEAEVNYSETVSPAVPPITNYLPPPARAAAAGVNNRTIQWSVSEVIRERANKAHDELVRGMARLVGDAGCVPSSNQLIDLFANCSEKTFLFEMKSVTADNYRAQVRRGVAQLYEYAWLQDLPAATLCLVTETKPPPSERWLVDYLTSDRKIHLCWQTGAGHFERPSQSATALRPVFA